MLTLITPTGDRPEAWALCKKWMRAQTYTGAVRWIIVDDGQHPADLRDLPHGWYITLVLQEPKPGENTQHRNLLAAKPHIGQNARVVIIEDDDYYGPGWLAFVADHIQTHELVGEIDSWYFDVARRVRRRCGNLAHASLCATAMQGRALTNFWRIVAAGAPYIDYELWRSSVESRIIVAARHVVGIKGMPGRPGIGVGHRMKGTPATHEDLHALIGADAQEYADFARA